MVLIQKNYPDTKRRWCLVSSWKQGPRPVPESRRGKGNSRMQGGGVNTAGWDCASHTWVRALPLLGCPSRGHTGQGVPRASAVTG